MDIFKHMDSSNVYFSQLQGISLCKPDGTIVGKIHDFFVEFGEPFPRVLAVQYIRNKKSYYVMWEDIEFFSPKKCTMLKGAHIRSGRTFPRVDLDSKTDRLLIAPKEDLTVDYPPLGKVILDHQIVDTNGKKVVRVNDINFFRMGPYLRVTHAEVGLRSMMRRLGHEKIIDFFVKLIRPKSPYLQNVGTRISWKHVHAIPDRNINSNVKINISNDQIHKMHPADLADILEELDSFGRKQIFDGLDDEKAADTLSEVEHDYQKDFIDPQNPAKSAQILEKMYTDDAADILGELDEEEAGIIISNIKDDETQEEIQELLEYDEDTAGGLMTTDIFYIQEHETKMQILDRIPEESDDFGTLYDLYIVDKDGKLTGVCTLRKLLSQKEDIPIREILRDREIYNVTPQDSYKAVASIMSKYNLINVPVLNEERKLMGVVSVDDVLPWILDER